MRRHEFRAPPTDKDCVIGAEPRQCSRLFGTNRRNLQSQLLPQREDFGIRMGRLETGAVAGVIPSGQIPVANGGSNSDGSIIIYVRRAIGASGTLHRKGQIHIQQRRPNTGSFADRGEWGPQSADNCLHGRDRHRQCSGAALNLARYRAQNLAGFVRLQRGGHHHVRHAPARRLGYNQTPTGHLQAIG